MIHVFIVNDTTLKYHLEYMFAGTGAKSDAPFLEDANYQNPRRKEDGLTAPAERNLVAMVADISRIRTGDKVIFYLQASNHEGKFYGVFKVVGDPFYDSNNNNYLSSEMGKNLNLMETGFLKSFICKTYFFLCRYQKNTYQLKGADDKYECSNILSRRDRKAYCLYRRRPTGRRHTNSLSG